MVEAFLEGALIMNNKLRQRARNQRFSEYGFSLKCSKSFLQRKEMMQVEEAELPSRLLKPQGTMQKPQ